MALDWREADVAWPDCVTGAAVEGAGRAGQRLPLWSSVTFAEWRGGPLAANPGHLIGLAVRLSRSLE